jgi:diketogulonate reductase-like aldo/keto reductase
VILRWHFQTGWALVPKSVNPRRVLENSRIFDFQLDEADMAVMAGMDAGKKFLPDPDNMDF